jgi:serine/threonine-protein kinase
MPSTLNPNIPGGLEQIIMKDMALDPKNRYDSATQMLYGMEEFRKDPTILFDYFMGSGANLHVLPPVAQPERAAVPPRTTAERVAGTPVRRDTQPPRREPQQPRRDMQTPRGREAAAVQASRRRQEQEEERSNISTIAIVACSVVAVIAIIILLLTMLNGGFGPKTEYAALPNLVGLCYDDVKGLENFQLVLQERKYSDDYDADVIIDQVPAYEGQEVVVGTKIYVTVSSGAEPQVKTMIDLTELDEAQAKSFLLSQDPELQILVKTEPSDTVDAGLITRTEPAEGVELTKGQTVFLWVSEGPDVKMAKMPNVLGRDIETALSVMKAAGFNNVEAKEVESEKTKGVVVSQSEEKNTDVDVTTKIYLEYSAGKKVAVVEMPNVLGQNLSTAIGVLKAMGFTNIKYERVESDEAKDTVVRQSVPEGFEVEVTAEIKLQYSEGPKETTAPTTSEPTTGSDVEVTFPYTLVLPTGMTEPYTLMIRKNGVDVMPEPYFAQPTETTLVVELTGSGVQTYQLIVNGEVYSDFDVEFIPYG